MKQLALIPLLLLSACQSEKKHYVTNIGDFDTYHFSCINSLLFRVGGTNVLDRENNPVTCTGETVYKYTH